MRRTVLNSVNHLKACSFAGGLVIIAFPLAANGWNSQPKAPAPLPKINPNGLTSSTVCGACHQAIHAVWQGSQHAHSWSNSIFQAGYRRAVGSFGASAAELCLSCHTPTVRYTKDYAVNKAITKEGITCDFCHSVSGVDLSDSVDPVRLSVGKIKYGPLLHAQSPAHKIVNSQLHRKSEFCAACHEYRNANGLLVLETYSEWKSSIYAKRGKQCQDCHMPLIPGRVVALQVKQDAPQSVNLHDISGSHDLEHIRKAATLKLDQTEWFGDKVWVYLKVANEGSGHCFPTGLPLHRAVLEVTLQNNGVEVDRRVIPFEKVVLDEQGHPMQHEADIFLKGARIRSDTRLRPVEVRSLEIIFRKVAGTRLQMKASLFYQYTTQTLVVDHGVKRVKPVEMKILLASVGDTIIKPGR